MNATHSVFSNALSIVKLLHHPLKLFLQAQLSGPLFFSGSWQNENPFLKGGPQVRSGVSGFNQREIRFGLWLSSNGGIYWVLCRCGRSQRVSVYGQHCMPLAQSSGHTTPDGFLGKLQVRSGMSTTEAVQETVLETGQKCRGEATSSK